MMAQFHVVAAVLFGAVIGSFLNVCIHRLPLRESIVHPGSRCPRCRTAIAWYDNIPVLSYAWLQGRCRKCGARISWRYPFVEALNAAGYGFILWRYDVTPTALVYCALFSTLIVVSFIDIDHQIIPNRITYPGMVIGLVVGTWMLPQWWDSLVGFAVGGGYLWLVAEVYFRLTGKEGMGFGDVKLLAMVGAFLGWKQVIVALILGAFMGAIFGLTLFFSGKIAWREYIKFGPFLSLGTIAGMLYGPEIWNWYMDFVDSIWSPGT